MKRSTMRLTLLLVTMILLLAAGAGVPGVRGATSAVPMLADGGIGASHILEIYDIHDREILVDLESIEVSTDVIEYLEGGAPILRKRPGQTRYSDVTLACVDDCPGVLDWFYRAATGQVSRHNMRLRFLDATGRPTSTRWDFYECWPDRLQGTLAGDGQFYQNRFQIACEWTTFTY